MKRYRQKETGGKWENKQRYHQKNKRNTRSYDITITYPWKNQEKLIRST